MFIDKNCWKIVKIRIQSLLKIVEKNVNPDPRLNNTARQKSLDPFYVVTSDIKWVKTSWTYSRTAGIPTDHLPHLEPATRPQRSSHRLQR